MNEERMGRTVAQVLRVPADPLVEAVFRELREGHGEIELARHQRDRLSPLDLLRMEWELAKRIVEAVRAADGGGA